MSEGSKNGEKGKRDVSALIKNLQKKGKISQEIQLDITKTLDNDSSSNSTIKIWAADFKRARESTEDDPLSKLLKYQLSRIKGRLLMAR